MTKKNETRVLLGRHSLRKGGNESKRHPGITLPGVELGKKTAQGEILDFIEQSPENSIVFLAGVSDEIRTRSTARVYAATLKQALDGDKNIFISHRQINKWRHSIDRVSRIANTNTTKRLVIDYPIFLKQLSSERAGTIADKSEYFKALKARTGEDQHKLVRMWIETNGYIKGIKKGPRPQDIADNYKRAIERLEQFIRKQLPNRPVSIMIVGHSWELDVAITAFANNGKVNLESFDRVTRGGIIKEAECARIVFGSQGTTVTYRGKEFTTKPKP